MAAVTICSDFGAPQNKVCYWFPIYLPWNDGARCHDLSFLNVELQKKPTFPLSSFTFIKRLFSSSSLSAVRVVSSAYLRLLIFLPAFLIPTCASSSQCIILTENYLCHTTSNLSLSFPSDNVIQRMIYIINIIMLYGISSHSPLTDFTCTWCKWCKWFSVKNVVILCITSVSALF